MKTAGEGQSGLGARCAMVTALLAKVDEGGHQLRAYGRVLSIILDCLNWF